ncbi:hypothetical protein BC939DRAFT_476078 [Gamsiella multidivaricata]|uniref:uncharacterized protein n=1 Tax=Gamsiella multidivaricata TaxID=101098 RepID=UPI00221F0717|nr:uncharacterized protein BC939DRAFT_476078 [Gamsiella multidivaricata]KAI7825630.1 hypothetical protein BC939DRAFT_476078 [Gamsiella multidivaricata]
MLLISQGTFDDRPCRPPNLRLCPPAPCRPPNLCLCPSALPILITILIIILITILITIIVLIRTRYARADEIQQIPIRFLKDGWIRDTLDEPTKELLASAFCIGCKANGFPEASEYFRSFIWPQVFSSSDVRG